MRITEDIIETLEHAADGLGEICDCGYPKTDNYCGVCLAESLIRTALDKIKR